MISNLAYIHICRYVFAAHSYIASFPGSCAGEEEREPGTHCSRMRQVPLVTCTLLRYIKIMVNFSLLTHEPGNEANSYIAIA